MKESVVCESCERCRTFNESRRCDFCEKLPKEMNVDGMIDRGGRIRFLGKATRQPDGTWRCLAEVEGTFCVVEVRMRTSHLEAIVLNVKIGGEE